MSAAVRSSRCRGCGRCGERKARSLARDEVGEERDVGEEGDDDSGEGGERQRVKEDEAEDAALLTIALRRGAGDDDARSGDHLAHDASGSVG